MTSAAGPAGIASESTQCSVLRPSRSLIPRDKEEDENSDPNAPRPRPAHKHQEAVDDVRDEKNVQGVYQGVAGRQRPKSGKFACEFLHWLSTAE